jgi:hypothetical protein
MPTYIFFNKKKFIPVWGKKRGSSLCNERVHTKPGLDHCTLQCPKGPCLSFLYIKLCVRGLTRVSVSPSAAVADAEPHLSFFYMSVLLSPADCKNLWKRTDAAAHPSLANSCTFSLLVSQLLPQADDIN